MRVRSVILMVGVSIGALTLPANAQITQTDLLIAGRVLGFIDTLKHNSAVRVGIVYDPALAKSAQQAAELKALMAGGLRIGGLDLRPVMVPIGNVEGTGVDAFLLTEGLGAEAARVGRVNRERKIPCITFDLSQVSNGNCAMGVSSWPKIQVFVNREAADACGMELAAVFRMMIKEI